MVTGYLGKRRDVRVLEGRDIYNILHCTLWRPESCLKVPVVQGGTILWTPGCHPSALPRGSDLDAAQGQTLLTLHPTSSGLGLEDALTSVCPHVLNGSGSISHIQDTTQYGITLFYVPNKLIANPCTVSHSQSLATQQDLSRYKAMKAESVWPWAGSASLLKWASD